MSNAVVFNEYIPLATLRMMGALAFAECDMCLTVDTIGFSDTQTYAVNPYVDPPLGSYAPVRMTLASFTVNTGSGPTYPITGNASWSMSNPNADAVTITGAYLSESAETTLWWGASFDSPVVVAAGDTIALVINDLTNVFGPCGTSPPPPPPSGVLLRDTFTDANGTPLTSHEPEVGGPWLVVSTGATTTPSILLESDAATPQYSLLISGDGQTGLVLVRSDSITLTLVGTVQSGLYLGAVIRCADPSNLFVVEINGSGSTLLFDQFIAGAYVNRLSAPLSLTPPEVCTITVTLSSDTMTAAGYAGSGSATLTYTSASNIYAYAVGFRQGWGTGNVSPCTASFIEVTTP